MFRRRSRKNSNKSDINKPVAENINSQPNTIVEQSEDNPGVAPLPTTTSLNTTYCMGKWFGQVKVAEAQFLWARYKQLLQGNNKLLTDDVLTLEPFASNFILRQIWHTIPSDENGFVTFPSFFGVIKWWQTVDQETKLRGIFKLMNNDQQLDVKSLQKIFLQLDETQDEALARKKAEVIISCLDKNNQGFIDEEQWLQALSSFSSEEIDNLTNMNILLEKESPSQVLPSPSPSSPVPEDVLVTISSKIGEKDWKPLAEKLGFNDKEIKLIKRQYSNRSREQAFQMLRSWSEKDGATKQKLEFALRRCGMDDILFALQNE